MSNAQISNAQLFEFPLISKGREERRTLPPAHRLLYTRQEAAELLSLSVSTVQMLISRGLLHSRKMGHKRLIPHASLVAFSQKNLPSLWLPKRDGKTVNTERSAKRVLARPTAS